MKSKAFVVDGLIGVVEDDELPDLCGDWVAGLQSKEK